MKKVITVNPLKVQTLVGKVMTGKELTRLFGYSPKTDIEGTRLTQYCVKIKGTYPRLYKVVGDRFAGGRYIPAEI